MFFKDGTADEGKHSSRQNLVGGERMGFSRQVLFLFLHGLGALGSEAGACTWPQRTEQDGVQFQPV